MCPAAHKGPSPKLKFKLLVNCLAFFFMVLFVLFRVIIVNVKAGDSDHTFCITETDKRSFFLWPRETLLILILSFLLFVFLRYLLGRWQLTQPLVEALQQHSRGSDTRHSVQKLKQGALLPQTNQTRIFAIHLQTGKTQK